MSACLHSQVFLPSALFHQHSTSLGSKSTVAPQTCVTLPAYKSGKQSLATNSTCLTKYRCSSKTSHGWALLQRPSTKTSWHGAAGQHLICRCNANSPATTAATSHASASPRLDAQNIFKHQLPSGLSLEVIEQKPLQEGGAANDSGATRGEKAPLVFVHGSYHAAWCYAEHWLPFFSSLGHHCFSVSLLGQGGSDVPDAPVAGTIQSHAADLSHFIRHAVGSPPILIGHSFGGLIVQAYLAELALVWGGPPAAASDGWAAPFSSLTAAALVCSVPPTGNSPMVMRFLRTRPIASFKITMSLAAKKFETNLGLCRESFFSPAMPDDQVARFQALLKGSSRVPLFDLRKLNTELPAGKPPAGGVPPVLVLGAANDFIVDKEGVKETAAYYSTTAVIVPDIAHDVMLDVGWERAAWTLHNWIDGIHI